MPDQIISREAIAKDADLAAQRFVEHGVDQPCPHPEGTEAALIWKTAYARFTAYYRDPAAEDGSA
jgi:hypothetical protein